MRKIDYKLLVDTDAKTEFKSNVKEVYINSIKGTESDIKETVNDKQIILSIESIPTYLDYEISPHSRMENGKLLDNRCHCNYYISYLKNDHLWIALFTKNSLTSPAWMRFTYLILNWSILFTLNALMYSDEYIDSRYEYKFDIVKFY